jgi:transcriptional regulator GlxA family with amidase domain
VSSARTVGILIFDDVEVLDFAGPFEVFSMASAISPESERPFDVLLIAQESRPYRTSVGVPALSFEVIPHCTLEAAPRLDVLVVPGGQGTRVEDGNSVLLDWLARTGSSAEIAASVCTGAFLYAACGLLDGQRATTHARQIGRLRETHSGIEVVEQVRWVDEGHIVSSAGVSAGIDVSLHLVARLLGDDVARRTARAMQYDGPWETPSLA